MNADTRSSHGSRLTLPVILVTGFVSVVLAAVTARVVVSKSMSSSPGSSSDIGTKELVVRLERLEQQVGREPGRNEPDGFVEAEGVMNVDVDDIRIMNQRLTRLEKMQEARQVTDRRQAEFTEHVRRISEVYTHEAAIRTMSDPSADDEMKATAWRSIRFSAAQAWTDEIVMEAVRIGTTANDPWLRADIWRQAHANHTNPLLLQPLLQALANDPDASVRSEAAETLDLYIDEFGVREALQSAGQFDASPDVREQAMSSLQGPNGGY